MASSLLVKLVCLAIVCLVALGGAHIPKAQAKVTCGQVVSDLTPCVSYLLNGATKVPSQCCNGVRTLYNQAQTTADRQAVCNCIKDAVNGINYNSSSLNRAAGLPKNCGVNIPYQISPSTDCSRVQRG